MTLKQGHYMRDYLISVKSNLRGKKNHTLIIYAEYQVQT
jgi:hypothetical protein